MANQPLDKWDQLKYLLYDLGYPFFVFRNLSFLNSIQNDELKVIAFLKHIPMDFSPKYDKFFKNLTSDALKRNLLDLFNNQEIRNQIEFTKKKSFSNILTKIQMFFALATLNDDSVKKALISSYNSDFLKKEALTCLTSDFDKVTIIGNMKDNQVFAESLGYLKTKINDPNWFIKIWPNSITETDLFAFLNFFNKAAVNYQSNLDLFKKILNLNSNELKFKILSGSYGFINQKQKRLIIESMADEKLKVTALEFIKTDEIELDKAISSFKSNRAKNRLLQIYDNALPHYISATVNSFNLDYYKLKWLPRMKSDLIGIIGVIIGIKNKNNLIRALNWFAQNQIECLEKTYHQIGYPLLIVTFSQIQMIFQLLVGNIPNHALISTTFEQLQTEALKWRQQKLDHDPEAQSFVKQNEQMFNQKPNLTRKKMFDSTKS